MAPPTHRTTTRRATLLTCAAAGAAATMVLAAQAGWAASPPDPTGSAPPAVHDVQDITHSQKPLLAAAVLLRDSPEIHSAPEYSTIVLGDDEVVLWWRGGAKTMTPSAQALVAKASQSAPVRVATAKHGRQEVLAASATLERSAKDHPGFLSIAAEPDGSTLTVRYDENQTTPDTSSQHTRLTRTLPDTGIPTTVQTTPPPQHTSRNDDASPWSGGAVIQTPVEEGFFSQCTSGFGVDTPQGPALWIAGHCGEDGAKFLDPTGETIGTVSQRDSTLDIELVSTDAVSGKIYVGGEESTSSRTVAGARAPFVGERLCQSGNTSAEATGGPVCGLEVVRQDTDSDQAWVALQEDGLESARSGDSGGPVYSENEDGSVVAVGTTSAISGSNSETMYFGGFDVAQEAFGISIITGGDEQAPPSPEPTPPPGAPAPEPSPVAFTVRGESGLCVAAGSTTTKVAPVRLQDCDDTAAQRWTFSEGSLLTPSGSCVGVQEGTRGALQTGTCDGSLSQRWVVRGGAGKPKTVVNMDSSLCVTDPTTTTQAGSRLRASTCTGSPSQKWEVTAA